MPKISSPWLPAILLSLALAAVSSCKSGYSSNSGNGYPTAPPPPPATLELNSGDFAPGAVYQHTFATAGTYGYHCNHHSPMTGVVHVTASATETQVAVSITSSTTPFPEASVKPGGRVVWTNNTGMVHTVTSN
jgi:plastocyanin